MEDKSQIVFVKFILNQISRYLFSFTFVNSSMYVKRVIKYVYKLSTLKGE